MPYRQTDNVARKLAARHDAILAAARDAIAARRHGSGANCAGRGTRRHRDRARSIAISPPRPTSSPHWSGFCRAKRSPRLAMRHASAPGPLSALAAAFITFAARALARRRLATRADRRAGRGRRRRGAGAVPGGGRRRIRAADRARRLPVVTCPSRTPQLTATALVGALIEGLIGPGAPAVTQEDAGKSRAQVQALDAAGVAGAGRRRCPRARSGGADGAAGGRPIAVSGPTTAASRPRSSRSPPATLPTRPRVPCGRRTPRAERRPTCRRRRSCGSVRCRPCSRAQLASAAMSSIRRSSISATGSASPSTTKVPCTP